MKYFQIVFVVLFLATSCDPSKRIATVPASDFENRDLDTLFVTAAKPDSLREDLAYELPNYNPTYAKEHDLLHTALDVRFDWDNQWVIGKANLKLSPHFYATDKIRLDAKGFVINKVSNAKTGKDLAYDYDGQNLVIDLGKTYTRKETFELFIDYIAKPAERDAFGGSDAITSDQGLFFINHDGSDPNKPMQIWTQGETEHNSRWFPTIDKPNERCTQEIKITVQDKFNTLSNGLRVSSNKNADGTRTDHWKMDQPHAPYLFMIGVGEFAVVEDEWNGITVDYYVEKEYEEDARAIFNHTLEMLDFFSEKTGVPYPWQKYSQIVVRDYVSGAMENTTAVIFGEFVQLHEDELIDNHNDKIVAHELFHHWFGDLVTCESWSNLTLNEGFANYSEYLWMEHKYGKDAADYHLMTELNGYLGESRTKMHPLIHFGYEDKEDMFDAHSYNKGGLVLHMLRNYIGDDAFWASLNKYLTDNAYTEVEADELRMAFEDMVGTDMNWFFDQWYFKGGHPVLEIDYDYDETKKEISVIIEQTQDKTKVQPPIFELPFAIDLYIGKRPAIRKMVRMTERKQTFTFEVPEKPVLVNVDADKILLCEKKDNKTEAEYAFQYFNAPLFLDRYEALSVLKNKSSAEAASVIKAALSDPFWAIRGLALEASPVSAGYLPTYAKMVTDDKHSNVRGAAIEKLAESGDKTYIPALKTAIEKDPTTFVKSSALQSLIALDIEEATKYAAKLEDTKNSDLLGAISEIYAESGDVSKLDFFEEKYPNVDGYAALTFLENYLYLAVSAESTENNLGRATRTLRTIALDMTQSPWGRFGATRALAGLRSEMKVAVQNVDGPQKGHLSQQILQLDEYIAEIKKAETNPQVLEVYSQF